MLFRSTFENWLAAAPIVALGAPLGAFMVDWIGRKPTLLFVAVLCVGQFGWTCYTQRMALGVTGLILALSAVILALFGFERLRAWGAVLVGERKAKREFVKRADDSERVARQMNSNADVR